MTDAKQNMLIQRINKRKGHTAGGRLRHWIEGDDTYKRESEKKHLGNTVEHDQIDETGSKVNTKHTGQESARDRGMNRDADWQINMETRLT